MHFQEKNIFKKHQTRIDTCIWHLVNMEKKYLLKSSANFECLISLSFTSNREPLTQHLSEVNDKFQLQY
jgi:hypothetical protein